MPTAMITFNGRITLPSQVRRKLGLKIGDNVEFVENEKGQFALAVGTGRKSCRDFEHPHLESAEYDEELEAVHS